MVTASIQHTRSGRRAAATALISTLVLFGSSAAVAQSYGDKGVQRESVHQGKPMPSAQNNRDVVRREENWRRFDYRHEGSRIRFQDGRWHRFQDGRYLQAPPPPGFWIRTLPPYYRTWRVGPTPYYIVDDIYFRPLGNDGGYVVVNPPQAVYQSAPVVSPPMAMPAPAVPAYSGFLAELYAYPKGSQTEARIATDKQECAQWAGSQVLSDPWAAPYSEQQKDGYRRAFGACMEARNYVVR